MGKKIGLQAQNQNKRLIDRTKKQKGTCYVSDIRAEFLTGSVTQISSSTTFFTMIITSLLIILRRNKFFTRDCNLSTTGLFTL